MIRGGEQALLGRLPILETIIIALGRVTGWRVWLISLFLGVVSSLSLPPVNAWPLLLLTFPILLWMLWGERSRKGYFACGWWFGFGYFVASLYWIPHALLVFSDALLWMVPFAALGLPAFLAIYTGLASLLVSRLRQPVIQVLAFAGIWVLFEWLRGVLFTGFPWNLIGYAWTGSDSLIQMAAHLGIYGVSFLVMLMVCLPAALPLLKPRMAVILLVMSAAIPLVSWQMGSHRLEAAGPVQPADAGQGAGLRMVQPAIPQREKWGRSYRTRNFRAFLELSRQDRPDWVKNVIWPETAATFFLEEMKEPREIMAGILPQDGLLITGAPRRDRTLGTLHNSALVISPRGDVVESYDKAHLVPFGEYVPLRGILPIDKVTHGASDYTAGAGVRTLFLSGLPPVSMLICYEVVFPGAVVNAGQRPAWILNLTNDAWYGRTAGPYQHLAITRVRAIEEGVPVVRAANTGISAVFDSYGREVGRIGLEQVGYLDFSLPRQLDGETLFSKLGNLLVLLLVAVLLVLLFLVDNRSQSKQF